MHRRNFWGLLWTIGSIRIVALIARSAGQRTPFRSFQHHYTCRSRYRMTTQSSEEGADPMQGNNEEEGARFGRFWIPAASIFVRTPHSIVFVNLRPIVPGHVLVMPRRVVPHLRDLSVDNGEYDDLWRTVRTVQSILSRRYINATDFNVAVQDGPGAGQSVPHVHVHILPRVTGDLARNDDIYDALERWAPRENVGTPHTSQNRALNVPADEDRRDRTAAEMAAEAEEYRHIAAANNVSSDP